MIKQAVNLSNRNNRTNQNEITLPPIVEAQVSTNNMSSSNLSTLNTSQVNTSNGLKKNGSSTRVDSGIAVDYSSDNNAGGMSVGGGWTLSPNGSENEADLINPQHTSSVNGGINSSVRNLENVITTLELVENPNSLKKNNTSSTLNSYGKSSSIQSKLTATTNNTNQTGNTSSKKNYAFNISAASTNSSNQNQQKVVDPFSNGNLSIIASEQNYLDSITRLNSFNNLDELSSSNKLNNSVNNLNTNPSLNRNTIFISNINENNKNIMNLINFERSHSNNNLNYKNLLNNGSNNNVNEVSKQVPLTRIKSAARVRDLNENKNVNSNNNNNNLLSTPRKPILSRQNTTLSNDLSPLANRRNSNLTTTTTQIQTNVMITNNNSNNKPVPKPRAKIERRTATVQRQNSFIPISNVENSAFINNNINTQNQRQSSHLQLQRQDTKNKFVLNTNSTIANKLSGVGGSGGAVNERPKTSVNRQINTANLNKNSVNLITNNNNNNNLNLKQNQSQIQTNQVKELVNTSKQINSNTSNMIANNGTIDIENNINNNNNLATNNPNLLGFESDLPMEMTSNINQETGLNEYTLMRIIKWLEDIENCTNMIKPPSQLTWTSNANTNRLQNDYNRNFNNEYCLSDYDSLDDQIIEYNRVVDKTFHIVHDED